jgi:hypothetical protein
MPQNDPASRKSDGIKDTATGWNTTAIVLTTTATQKSNGTLPTPPTTTGWGATQIILTTSDIAKQNGFVTNKGGNGWGI